MSTSGATIPRKSTKKNVAGARTDPAWKHGIEIAPQKVQCKYCQVVRHGGIYRLKHHLACTSFNVCPCPQVPDDVRREIVEILSSNNVGSSKKRTISETGSFSVDGDVEGGSGSKDSVNKFFGKNQSFGRQTTLNEKLKKKERDDLGQLLAQWFYTSAIPFNAINNPIFHKFLKGHEDYGKGWKPPSYHEIRETFLKREVEETKNVVQRYKQEWEKTGCTIMSDGWTDQRKRTIINFLVNSPAGTVFLRSVDATHISKTAEKLFLMLDEIVEYVGESNVVQVITDNAANYKAAGKLLMEKRNHLYWTPCAAHCIDLMLEDLDKNDIAHKETIAKAKLVVSFIYSSSTIVNWMKEFTKGKELIRPAITRFATSYLTLSRLNELKGDLFCFFSSEKWTTSVYAKKKKGQQVCNIIFDSQVFWANVELCIKIGSPLLKVLRMVDSDATPAMGFLYKAMEKAKQEIQANLRNVKKRYEPVFVVIDKRWDGMLSHDLHAAGYYLNPQFHYSSSFSNDPIVKQGFYNCIGRMVANKEERIKIDLQLESFKHAKGLFGFENAILMRNKKTPADWWDSYGDQCPELKRFAIRVLSLTCSSSGCERNWSAFEMVHSKRRNRLTHKKMDELVFVMCNLKLKHEKEMQCKPPNFDAIQEVEVGEIHDSEWITEEGDLQHNGSTWKEALNPNSCHNSDEDVDEVEYNEEFSGSPTHIRSSFQEGPSSSRSRGKRMANQTQRFQLIDEDDEDEHEFTNDRDDERHNGDYEFANDRVDFQRMGDENAHANDASEDLRARHIDECSFSTGWKPWNKTVDDDDGDGDGDGD